MTKSKRFYFTTIKHNIKTKRSIRFKINTDLFVKSLSTSNVVIKYAFKINAKKKALMTKSSLVGITAQTIPRAIASSTTSTGNPDEIKLEKIDASNTNKEIKII